MKGTTEQVTALQPNVPPTDFLEIQMRPAEDLISLNPSTRTGLWVMGAGAQMFMCAHKATSAAHRSEIMTDLCRPYR